MGAQSTSTAVPTRASLLDRLRVGSADDDWREFYALYWRPVYGYARRFGLSCQEAEDVVQEVMAAAVRAMPTFEYRRRQGSFRGWMGTLVRHKVIDRMRRRRARVPDAASQDRETPWEDVPDSRQDAHGDRWEREWEQALLSLAMERASADLAPDRWEAFRRMALEEESPASVARDCGLSVNALYVLKHRILEQIRAEADRLRAEEWG